MKWLDRKRAECHLQAGNAGSIPATSTMKQPDAKKHFYVSILKSTVRIVGYALIPFNITAAVGTLIISEAIGIIEETV